MIFAEFGEFSDKKFSYSFVAYDFKIFKSSFPVLKYR